jgi:signal transduction histidine kinase
VQETVNILLVDDEPGGLVALEAILEPLGQNLIKARSGHEALRHLLSRDFALILLDVRMPDLDGFETASLIRERERNRNTPIIFLTAGDESEVLRGYAVGAVDYVFKPVRTEVLRSKVSVFVELARATEIVRRQAAERKQAEEAIQELNANLVRHAARLEAANKELESFSYSISHDLRAPLRAIDGFARMLQEDHGDRLDDEGRRRLEKISNGTRKMSALIDDLLEFSRLGRSPLSPGAIDMTALVREVVDEIQSVPGQRVPRCILKPLPAALGDRALIRQVWINLLSNAVKFTGHRDAPLMEIGGSSEDAENVYYVKDNGTGFDMRHYDKLFRVFQRLHSSAEFPGTGAGLAIVQRVVSRHGGRVWAESKVDVGAEFYFTLPNNNH